MSVEKYFSLATMILACWAMISASSSFFFFFITTVYAEFAYFYFSIYRDFYYCFSVSYFLLVL